MAISDITPIVPPAGRPAKLSSATHAGRPAGWAGHDCGPDIRHRFNPQRQATINIYQDLFRCQATSRSWRPDLAAESAALLISLADLALAADRVTA
jgi:hypothetical protein